MDFDVSTSSVTEALSELQRKLQSVQEDTELFSSLEKKACASFQRHRSELTLLLQKERAIHAASEDRLRDELQRLLLENESAQKQLASLRLQRERECREETQTRRQQLEEREAMLRRELSELQEKFNTARADIDFAQQEKTWHEIQLREALERQRGFNADLQRLRREAEERLAREEAEVHQQQRRHHCAHYGLEKVFLPSGPPDQSHTTSPASHHIAAIVSTVERQNCYRPRLYYRRRGISSPLERRLESPIRHSNSALNEKRSTPLLTMCSSPTSLIARETALSTPQQAVDYSTATVNSSRMVTCSGRHLEAVCRSLLHEIVSMRKEYQDCTEALNDPSADSVEVSRRMRGIMVNLDRKVLQLRGLRQQQAKVEDKMRLHDMMVEIAAENGYCESVYGDLLDIIRS